MSSAAYLPRVMLLAWMLNLGAFCQAEDKLRWNEPPYDQFAGKLQGVLEEHYPKLQRSVSQENESEIRWHADTRKFMVHIPSLTGKWQDATEMEGPNRQGILCTATIREGPYQGMAATPQTFERFYFKVLMMTPYRKDIDAHVVVRLYYPPGVDPKFLTEFAKTVRQFSAEESAEK
ncbi:hypothetical protein [Blastopirellula marina]|uniref:Uncharacterized protein n=1 Tax=Blastopirellula marina TaxID=124 RepID=A0A2S8GK13_9BACT|nr:hypothetical protein [Blastopirellula marina]PQO44775.1 hypothetical protein C5Y93_16890 [Blastopirellula marina]